MMRKKTKKRWRLIFIGAFIVLLIKLCNSSPNQAQDTIQSQNTIWIPVVGKGMVKIDIDNITHLEARSNYTYVFDGSSKIHSLSKTLSVVMRDHFKMFCRSHHSYAINPSHIKSCLGHRRAKKFCNNSGRKGVYILSDDTCIPISEKDNCGCSF